MPPHRLVEICPPAFPVQLDLRYATADNITGRSIYARRLCLLREEAARALRRAVSMADAAGLSLVVFDAYRPPAAQWRLWNALPDDRFIADPRRGSSHSRGIAIDLTLSAAEGRLDMGTGFDAMVPASRHGDLSVSRAAQINRLLLLGLMTAAGFEGYSDEWWHYQLPDPARFPLIDDGALGPRLMAAGD